MTKTAGELSHGDKGWIGVDFDGTLCTYDHFKGHELHNLGQPITPMVERVKRWLAEGRKVKIFTVRADDSDAIPHIQQWLIQNGLPLLDITNVKDRYMDELWDDRVVQVEPNTGRMMCPSPRGYA